MSFASAASFLDRRAFFSVATLAPLARIFGRVRTHGGTVQAPPAATLDLAIVLPGDYRISVVDARRGRELAAANPRGQLVPLGTGYVFVEPVAIYHERWEARFKADPEGARREFREAHRRNRA